jgi:hypothetical protein
MGRFERGVGRAFQLSVSSASLVILLSAGSVRAQSEPARWGGTAHEQPHEQPQEQPRQAEPPPRARSSGLPWRDAMENAPRPATDETPKHRVWYGWQTLLADALGITLFVIAIADDESGVGFVSLGVATLGSPLVHFAHQNVEGAVISLSIRAASLGLAVLGAFLIADTIFNENSDSETATRNLIGGVTIVVSIAGLLAAIGVDLTVLAFEPGKPARSDTTSLMPWIDPTRGSYGLRFGMAL